MRADYGEWLKGQEYSENTQAAQLHRVGKVEHYYGNLDQLLEEAYDKLISELTYSTADERSGKPNPSKIPFDGNIRNNLQSYKNAIVRYRKFLLDRREVRDESTPTLVSAIAEELPLEKQRLSLERDMQAALRRDICLLEPGLRIVDDGAERAVASGFIDILCQDAANATVVIELKAGKTDARVVGQILGYMGDIMEEDDVTSVRGVIIAHDFDKRTLSAAKAVPNLKLIRYSISFRFEAEGGF
ncbi:endonuclease NucS domain-containing protein [Rhizobium rhizogenes]|uniref:endonuclease NucS domain-containing protein n=1 Tax=Rhizobium rhizogenes TaxID=359 RepID=UPI00226D8C80|nr:endonuclease NucS domain-containing protein [Rhizobium rhizogenes]